MFLFHCATATCSLILQVVLIFLSFIVITGNGVCTVKDLETSTQFQ